MNENIHHHHHHIRFYVRFTCGHALDSFQKIDFQANLSLARKVRNYFITYDSSSADVPYKLICFLSCLSTKRFVLLKLPVFKNYLECKSAFHIVVNYNTYNCLYLEILFFSLSFLSSHLLVCHHSTPNHF